MKLPFDDRYNLYIILLIFIILLSTGCAHINKNKDLKVGLKKIKIKDLNPLISKEFEGVISFTSKIRIKLRFKKPYSDWKSIIFSGILLYKKGKGIRARLTKDIIAAKSYDIYLLNDLIIIVASGEKKGYKDKISKLISDKKGKKIEILFEKKEKAKMPSLIDIRYPNRFELSIKFYDIAMDQVISDKIFSPPFIPDTTFFKIFPNSDSEAIDNSP